MSHSNLRLADGGLRNNLPVDLARSLAGGPVVTVDVLSWFRVNQPGTEPMVSALKHRVVFKTSVGMASFSLLNQSFSITEQQL